MKTYPEMQTICSLLDWWVDNEHYAQNTHKLLQEHMLCPAQRHWQPECSTRAHDAYAWSRRLARFVEKQQWFHYIAEIIRELRSLDSVFVWERGGETEWMTDSDKEFIKRGVHVSSDTLCTAEHVCSCVECLNLLPAWWAPGMSVPACKSWFVL